MFGIPFRQKDGTQIDFHGSAKPISSPVRGCGRSRGHDLTDWHR